MKAFKLYMAFGENPQNFIDPPGVTEDIPDGFCFMGAFASHEEAHEAYGDILEVRRGVRRVNQSTGSKYGHPTGCICGCFDGQ